MRELPEKYFAAAKQTAAYRTLSAAFASGKENNSYLLASPDPLLSVCVAKLVACGAAHAEAGSPLYARIVSGKCADVRIYGEDGFTAECADRVVADCQITPSELDRKTLILDLTHTNEAAQNKLLKTLEEAPPHAMFFVVATDKSALLPTVVSRLEELSPFLPTTVRLTPPDFSPYAALANYAGQGNLTEFDGLCGGEKAASLTAAINFVRAAAEGKTLKAASQISQKRDEAAETLGYIERIFGDVMRAASGLPVETFGLYDMSALTVKFPLAVLPRILGEVRRAVRRAGGGKMQSVADALAIAVVDGRS